MARGTKPRSGTKRAEKFKDGLGKADGINTPRHAGPGRASKTKPTGIKGAQLQKRAKRTAQGKSGKGINPQR